MTAIRIIRLVLAFATAVCGATAIFVQSPELVVMFAALAMLFAGILKIIWRPQYGNGRRQ